MQNAQVNGTTLAYSSDGVGEPVLSLHSGFAAESFAPLVQEAALAAKYRLINYHRRGYGASGPLEAPFTIADQARDCLALLDHLGVRQAHLVGHSFGANIALEVGRRAPQRVFTLSLLEPPLPWAMRLESAQMMMGVMGTATGTFQDGDVRSAVDQWLNAAFGPGWQAVIEQALPGGVEHVYHDGPAALGVEAPSLMGWDFGPSHLQELQMPVLAAYHVDTHMHIFEEVQQALIEHVPQLESLVIPNATHLLQIQNPRSVAEGLAMFLGRNVSQARSPLQPV